MRLLHFLLVMIPWILFLLLWILPVVFDVRILFVVMPAAAAGAVLVAARTWGWRYPHTQRLIVIHSFGVSGFFLVLYKVWEPLGLSMLLIVYVFAFTSLRRRRAASDPGGGGQSGNG